MEQAQILDGETVSIVDGEGGNEQTVTRKAFHVIYAPLGFRLAESGDNADGDNESAASPDKSGVAKRGKAK